MVLGGPHLLRLPRSADFSMPRLGELMLRCSRRRAEERRRAQAIRLSHRRRRRVLHAAHCPREPHIFCVDEQNIIGERAEERIARISEWMGLGDDLDRQVRTLSTGMTHRLGLARAMLHKPGILLLDEPTRSLDPIAASEFRRLLKDEIVRREGTRRSCLRRTRLVKWKKLPIAWFCSMKGASSRMRRRSVCVLSPERARWMKRLAGLCVIPCMRNQCNEPRRQSSQVDGLFPS